MRISCATPTLTERSAARKKYVCVVCVCKCSEHGYEFQYNKISCLGNEQASERLSERSHCACPINLEQVAAAGYLRAIASKDDNTNHPPHRNPPPESQPFKVPHAIVRVAFFALLGGG